MDYWTIFYWGWWISWVPFVGLFMAKISRGRTIREVVVGGFIAPIVYNFFYLTVLGSLGIKMERIMETAMGVQANIETGYINCTAMGYTGGEPVTAKAIALAEAGYYAIPCRAESMRYFDVLFPYGHGIGTFLAVCSLIGIIVYFMTSSDSGSFVDDQLSAGGLEEPPVVQRVYWAFTEGALACTIMYYGGTESMKALRSVSIVCGLPYTFLMCFMCSSLLRAVKWDSKEKDIVTSTRFTTGLFDWTEGFAPNATIQGAKHGAEKYEPGMSARCVSLVIGIFFPFYELHKMNVLIHKEIAVAWLWTVSIGLLQLAWIVCMILEVSVNNASALGWTFFFFMACCITVTRVWAREKYNVYGWPIEDFFVSLFWYPFAASQLGLHADYWCQDHEEPKIEPNPIPAPVAEKAETEERQL